MADFTSYEQIVKWLAKAKNPATGRKMRSLILTMDGNVVNVGVSWSAVQSFAQIRKGDVFTFTRSSDQMMDLSASVSSTLYKVFGLSWIRVGKGRYNVHYYDINGDARYWQARNAKTKQYEHFKGMSWDFGSGVCINPRKSVLYVVDTDNRKIWTTQLKKFRRAFLTRVRLGVVQQIIDDNQHVARTRIPEPAITKYVLEGIKKGNVDNTLISELVAYSKSKIWTSVALRVSHVVTTVETIINNNSIAFRQEFGVLRK